MARHSISLALTGSGGAGVMTAGNMLLDAAAASGCHGLMTRSAGPQIRGGEAAALLRLADFPIDSHDDRLDLAIAVDWENVQRFAAELALDKQSAIVADPAAGEMPAAIAAKGARLLAVPLKQIAKSCNGRPNMVALGVAMAALGLDEGFGLKAIDKTLEGRDAKTIEASYAAFRAGLAAGAALDLDCRLARGQTSHPSHRWVSSGNHAAGLGAIRGGIRFVAAYPITPASEVLEWLAPALRRVGGTLVQAEDELASINMAIGASFGGVPALTATSGPGLSLMLESIGLAVASETPVVVIDVMRGGPSTGIPTKSEQADLAIAIHGLHGDAPHLVVAPLSVADCLFTTQWAVHLAESTQAPAIVLSDQFLGQARAVFERPADIAFAGGRRIETAPGAGYARYALTADGVSPMTLPGTPGGQYTADGLEHDARGTPSSRADDHTAQMAKRARKLDGFDYGRHWAEIDGEGEIAVLSWGSTAGAVREAVARARAQGLHVRLITPRLLLPIQPARMAAALEGVRRVLVVEQSEGAQFHRYLRAHYDLPKSVEVMARTGALPFRPGEILGRIAAGGAS
ncbi:MAG: 2-oxoacid:acceptor oxidoreductase subunit alpha [Alphaproteobacteria bacterium]|nr:2-oxoacid:acceptor oxidoreductase subunit alpha [Alphaproteobacteria bacterium]